MTSWEANMAENKEWVIQGYQFSSQKDATQAKGELLKIQKLEEKMDYKLNVQKRN